MKSFSFFLCIGLLISQVGFAQTEKLLPEFSAPIVNDKDSITNLVEAGTIVFDASEDLPFMLDSSGQWRPLGTSTGLGMTYTPTISWSSGVGDVKGYWRRVGDKMEVQVYIPVTGPVPSAALTVNLPLGYTIDISKLPAPTPTSDNTTLGSGTILDSGSASFPALVTFVSSNSVRVNCYQLLGPSFIRFTSVTDSTPVTFGAGDSVGIVFSVPITDWN